MRDFMPCKGCDEPEACEIEGRCLEPAPQPMIRTEPVKVDLSAELHATLYVLHPDGSISPAELVCAAGSAAGSLQGKISDEQREALEDFDFMLAQWAKAYPLTVFPEPDLEVARKALEAAGLTLDAVSASNMRHVVTALNAAFDKVRAVLCAAGVPAGAAQSDTAIDAAMSAASPSSAAPNMKEN